MIEFTVHGVHLKVWAGQILGIGFIIAFVWLIWRAQRSPDNPIDLATMFVWPGTNQTSAAVMLAVVGGLTATWIVIDLALRNKMTAEILGAYMLALIFGKGMTEFANAWRDRGQPPPATNTTQVIDKAAVVSSAPPPNPPPAVPGNQPAPQAAIRRARKTPKPKGHRR